MRHIFIADDDPEDQFLLRMAFEENSVTNPLLFFNNGRELITYFDEYADGNADMPAFILLDMNMPLLTGKQVLEILKSNPKFACIPILIFSTSSDKKEIEECYQLGANCYMVKPDSFSDLVQLIDCLNFFWLRMAALPSFVSGGALKVG